MIIQHNINAMNANRQLGITQGSLSKSTEKLSSGYKINRAGDNAAGLAISEKMRGQIRGLSQASTNAEDGISLVQTAEGALQETQNILQRMRELAVQAGNDTNTDDDRTQIQKEITQLTNEVDRIATTSEFNTKKLLDGSQRGAIAAQDGNSSTEGTFANGMVSVGSIKTSDAKLVAVNDVIRITLQADCTAADAEISPLKTDVASACVGQTATKWATIESLNGLYGSDPGTVTIKEGAIELGATLATKGDTTTYPKISSAIAGMRGSAEGTLTISFTGVDKLKAGDVITISLQSCTAADPTIGDKSSLRLQVGANAGQEINLSINSMKAKDLGIVKTSGSVSAGATDGLTVKGQALDVTSQSKASLAIEAYDQALQKVSTERAKLGAVQNRLEHTIANLDTSEENLQSAESRIRDTDMADEMTKFSKDNILQQAGTSMLAQANQANQTVLSLLQ